ncbi:hypothetical protein POSPLADRAFT_1041011 [Postia placenta MAD-698-R-SB12]|uniref:Ribosome maturation protein SDO1/SBDS N-terminal domain-containing protein n=1 Tax=Postia placenta MAD-698-R-SB12 TaxID=670580 RepID=A0A1X6MSP7_9APHY|nr:hypothetical protein POSPLADRAFT_1041011 [Postia placenta MAD-698-R-SB12]OSX59397.1 hypothetical protein POSPLADRAFT_1041011 [Postia placenta MAD-698-R-SB12]
MVRALTKVVYKPDSQSTDEFTVIVNPAEFKKWKEGGTTIALTEVVDSFQVFFSNQGAQGILGTPSKQQLENVFGSSKDVDVIERILKQGQEQAGKGVTAGTTGLNVGKSNSVIDTRGKGVSGVP